MKARTRPLENEATFKPFVLEIDVESHDEQEFLCFLFSYIPISRTMRKYTGIDPEVIFNKIDLGNNNNYDAIKAMHLQQ